MAVFFKAYKDVSYLASSDQNIFSANKSQECNHRQNCHNCKKKKKRFFEDVNKTEMI